MYHIMAFNEGKVGYQYRANNVVTNIIYSLFLFLVCTKIVFIFSMELIVDSELALV